jgi:hypothetical protein
VFELENLVVTKLDLRGSLFHCFVLLIVAAIGAHGFCQEDRRTFQNRNGKSLEADVLGADLNTVSIRRVSDGKTFTLNRSELQSDDSAWISMWLKRPRTIVNGPAIEFEPFYPDRWKDKPANRSVVSWEGKEVVFFTSSANYDPVVMARLLDGLDQGWRIYADVVGTRPRPVGLSEKFKGKGTLVAVPDTTYLGAGALGYLGTTAIEVGYFYEGWDKTPGDYETLISNPKFFPGYYFYEMGRNYYVFGERHSLFTTGFAIAMREICMLEIGAERGGKDDKKFSQDMIQFEELFYKSKKQPQLAFDELGAKKNQKLIASDGQPLLFDGLGDFYASAILYLYRNYGGRKWVKGFYHNIMQCPVSPPHIRGGMEGQFLNFIVSANLAARRDLSKIFKDRWRFKIAAPLWILLSKIDWADETLTVQKVFSKLPVDNLPFTIAAQRPTFISEAIRERNLLKHSGMDSLNPAVWLTGTFRTPEDNNKTDYKDIFRLDRDVKVSGDASFRIDAPGSFTCDYTQKVNLNKGKLYLLSGWIKTDGVASPLGSYDNGAALVFDWFDYTTPLYGTNDWTYVTVFGVATENPDLRARAEIKRASGTAWFDDLVLIEIPNGLTKTSK